jgi:hypothetical protein
VPHAIRRTIAAIELRPGTPSPRWRRPLDVRRSQFNASWTVGLGPRGRRGCGHRDDFPVLSAKSYPRTEMLPFGGPPSTTSPLARVGHWENLCKPRVLRTIANVPTHRCNATKTNESSPISTAGNVLFILPYKRFIRRCEITTTPRWPRQRSGAGCSPDRISAGVGGRWTSPTYKVEATTSAISRVVTIEPSDSLGVPNQEGGDQLWGGNTNLLQDAVAQCWALGGSESALE